MIVLPQSLRARLGLAVGALVYAACMVTAWVLAPDAPRAGILGIGVGAALLAGLVAWWLAGRLVRPLEVLAASARRIAAGELGLEIPRVDAPLEAARLSRDLGDMKEVLLERQAALALAHHRLEDRVAERSAELTAARRQLVEAKAALRELAHVDALTGLASRRAAEDRLAIEMSRHRRSRHCLSVLLLDVDHLQRVSDTSGAAAGEAALKAVALAVQDACRAADGVARVGDDELLVAMPETPREGAQLVAAKIQDAVRALPDPRAAVTVSMGLVSHAEAYVDVEAVMRDAQAALRAAKDAGGNRVVAHEAREAAATASSSRSFRTSH